MGGDKSVRLKIIKDLNKVEERIVNLSTRLSMLENRQTSDIDDVESEEFPFGQDVSYEEIEVNYQTISKLSRDVECIFSSLSSIKKLMYLISALCVFSASLSLFVFFYTAAY